MRRAHLTASGDLCQSSHFLEIFSPLLSARVCVCVCPLFRCVTGVRFWPLEGVGIRDSAREAPQEKGLREEERPLKLLARTGPRVGATEAVRRPQPMRTRVTDRDVAPVNVAVVAAADWADDMPVFVFGN